MGTVIGNKRRCIISRRYGEGVRIGDIEVTFLKHHQGKNVILLGVITPVDSEVKRVKRNEGAWDENKDRTVGELRNSELQHGGESPQNAD